MRPDRRGNSFCKHNPTLRQTWPRVGPEAAMCVRKISAQCVLQFTPSLAAGCVLHRPVSRVIHCSELSFGFYFRAVRPYFCVRVFYNRCSPEGEVRGVSFTEAAGLAPRPGDRSPRDSRPTAPGRSHPWGGEARSGAPHIKPSAVPRGDGTPFRRRSSGGERHHMGHEGRSCVRKCVRVLRPSPLRDEALGPPCRRVPGFVWPRPTAPAAGRR